MNNLDINIDANEICKNMTISVNVVGLKKVIFKFKIVKILMYLMEWVLGTKVEFGVVRK